MGLCNGKFEALCKFLDITDYAELLRASNQSADHYRSDDSSDARFPVFQEPGLLDLELYLRRTCMCSTLSSFKSLRRAWKMMQNFPAVAVSGCC